ncbi:hypothetical protein T265_07775 [Opisthorchis viverrini]|uniref:Transposase IS30-like HTH domain-containing protein n=1 Tax=Opisthorchis viverrini TaxID=6198 RepID=A0A074ZFZ5_OPIVI|nr:hypothetical protein T265_07775 [Opisthorchis viverrini]KER24577.1 hypothetical protein T265_07775 [Opisthorchis viverrini]
MIGLATSVSLWLPSAGEHTKQEWNINGRHLRQKTTQLELMCTVNRLVLTNQSSTGSSPFQGRNMPKGTQLTTTERFRILALKQVGKSLRQIARTVGRSKTAVSQCLQFPATERRKKRSGRKCALSREQLDRLYAKASSNSSLSCQDLKEELNLPISRRQISRILKKLSVPRDPAIKRSSDSRKEDGLRKDLKANTIQALWTILTNSVATNGSTDSAEPTTTTLDSEENSVPR